MARLMLSDKLWSKLRKIMRQQRIYDKPGLRLMVEGILYRMRVGCPWRDLPAYFGKWNTIYKRFNNWSAQDKLLKIFKSLVSEPDTEWEFIDSSIVKAHQHSAGAAGEKEQAIGKSRGGNTTKVHMAADSFGLPIHFELTGGGVHDCKTAPILLKNLIDSDFLVADKGYNSEEIRELIHQKNSIPVIPRKSNSAIGNDNMDWCLYKYRHLVENLFARLNTIEQLRLVMIN